MKKKKKAENPQKRRAYYKNGVSSEMAKKILKERNISQARFGEMSGVTQANTNFNLNKKKISNIDLMVTLSEIAGITINELITGKKPQEVSELIKRLQDYEKQLNLLQDVVELQKAKIKMLESKG